jgi:ABC-type multidrug transport system ATPase subunit
MVLMLNVQSVTKRYGKTVALEGASLDLEAGQVLATVGSNGAGKSTLIKAVVGLIHFEGRVLVGGVDVARDGRAARRHIGYLPQNPAFHDDLNVRETAVFYARIRGASVEAARAAVEAVGLAEHAEKPVGALSGGMRQRLALAVAQVGDPPLLILDEPATGLDVAARLELRRFIREQRAHGKAVLLSTHWLEDVPTIADQVLVLDQGRTTYHGPSAGFAATATPRSRLYLRLNGHTADAISLIQPMATGEVARTGEWLAITCLADEKTRVLEVLLGAGITILDFRVEEATVASDAALPATAGVLPGDRS